MERLIDTNFLMARQPAFTLAVASFQALVPSQEQKSCRSPRRSLAPFN